MMMRPWIEQLSSEAGPTLRKQDCPVLAVVDMPGAVD
jgi:hypothetical protein